MEKRVQITEVVQFGNTIIPAVDCHKILLSEIQQDGKTLLQYLAFSSKDECNKYTTALQTFETEVQGIKDKIDTFMQKYEGEKRKLKLGRNSKLRKELFEEKKKLIQQEKIILPPVPNTLTSQVIYLVKK